jgi:hypothetical protein
VCDLLIYPFIPIAPYDEDDAVQWARFLLLKKLSCCIQSNPRCIFNGVSIYPRRERTECLIEYGQNSTVSELKKAVYNAFEIMLQCEIQRVGITGAELSGFDILLRGMINGSDSVNDMLRW